jgi:hypothetical protein
MRKHLTLCDVPPYRVTRPAHAMDGGSIVKEADPAVHRVRYAGYANESPLPDMVHEDAHARCRCVRHPHGGDIHADALCGMVECSH